MTESQNQTFSIVLVEDNIDTCRILNHLLVGAGYTVVPLNDGRVLLENNSPAPNVFILDITLPSIDGIALCKYLKIRFGEDCAPIIALSGNHDLKERALKAGAKCFIEKPFKIENLLNEVKRVIREPISIV
jgi:DNA-binding response OmpR family regulator